MSRILVDNQIRYKYEVGGESYITTHTLADHAADFIRGRGTRVFVAHHEFNASRSVVVKDVWLEDDRIEEGVHLEYKDSYNAISNRRDSLPGKQRSFYLLSDCCGTWTRESWWPDRRSYHQRDDAWVRPSMQP